MRYHHCLLATLALCGSSASGHALEVTANKALDVDASLGMKMDALQAALTVAINQILTCNNKGMVFASNASVPGRDADGCVATSGVNGATCTTANKVYDPTDSAADGNGCVNATVVQSPESKPMADMSFPASSYYQRTGDYWRTPTQTRDLTNYVDDGAPSFIINFNETMSPGGPVSCGGARSVTIPSIGLNASGNFRCQHDSSPTRVLWVYWSYIASSHHFDVYLEWYQSSHTNVSLLNMTAQYTASRLKFGNE
jgi:hypothetical protein